MTVCHCEYCCSFLHETIEIEADRMTETNTTTTDTITGSTTDEIPFFGEDLAGVTSDDALLENAHRDFCFDSATDSDADDLIVAWDPADEDNYDQADEGNPVDCLD